MRREHDPREQSAPSHRSQGGINGRVVRIVHVVNVAHWRRSHDGGQEQGARRPPADLYLGLKTEC